MSGNDWPVLLRSPGYRFPPLLPLAPQLPLAAEQR